ncbi:MAG: BamA/TamA family outer membrane protein [Candidatus Aminicenantes bacterium]|nr:BamA/TamA family outer membrane protein [Candidatus Aminicenantes bacterium]
MKRLSFFLFALLIFTSIGNAQYFGRNKVRYERFDFQIMETEHFDIYYYPDMEKAAPIAARMAERWYARLSKILNHELRGRQPLILYSSTTHFQQTSTISGILGEGVGGVTEALKRRVVLPLGPTLAATDHVIGHELVHAFQYDMTALSDSGYARATSSIHAIPLWMIEGLAEYLSIGPADPHTAMWMRDSLRDKKGLPSIKKLVNPRFFPYRFGQSVWAYITGRFGDDAVPAIMKSLNRSRDMSASIQKILGISVEELSLKWHEALKCAYNPLQEQTHLIDPSSRILFKGDRQNRLNIAPALSPDGSHIVFLSSRDLFSIDMYLADVRTGKISRKLVNTATDPHFESLQFIKSAGAWNREGTQFAFGAVSKGRPVLSIYDVRKGKQTKERAFEELGEILSPTWSPDGRLIAFSAQVGGFTDLFIYDLETDTLQRKTDDAFADLQPSWSPDGRRIAVVTDRFSTDLTLLSTGPLQIALLDTKTDRYHPLSRLSPAKHINPQWSPDSRSLYYISDQTGINNIYRYDLETDREQAVTNLYTGVTGITDMSPALSIASVSGRMAYSQYENNMFSILIREEESGAPFDSPPPSALNHALLPPRHKESGMVADLLRNPVFGLPQNPDYPVSPYKPKLKLDYLSQPQVAIGVDRFGSYGGGGIAMFFSDMMGYHNVSGMAQANSRLIDSSALLAYQNSRSRFNWGIVAQRIPYITGYIGSSLGIAGGEEVLVQQEYLFRQINYQVGGFASYPFSIAQRFEVSAGYRFIDFDKVIYTSAYSLLTGRRLLYEKERLPSPDGLGFAYATTALVYDTSLFGLTAPVVGRSYRFEFAPYRGSIRFSTVLADFRTYLSPIRPFTLAFRFMHYGRYGHGAEDSRLYPLFIGYETMVRGYNIGSFIAAEFEDETDNIYTHTTGSKILVANIELRFPFFGVLGIGKGYYGILPVDFIAFVDSGLAWTDADKAWFLEGTRRPVFSTGLGLRMNLFGYLIIGANYVHPFNRPGKKPYFQLSFWPGF